MGKSKKTTVGFHYCPAFHSGLGIGPIDAYLEFRGGDKTAWEGELTSSGTISINAPNLWGGEKDQGGIVGDVDVMFGEADQQANPYLSSVFGPQQSAWRGLATLVFKGGKYGAMNPYPQKASHKIRKIIAGWDCWYPETAEIHMIAGTPEARYFLDQRVVTSAPVAIPDQVPREMAIKYGWPYTLTGESYYFPRRNESGMYRSKAAEGDTQDTDSIIGLVEDGLGFNETAILKFISGTLFMVVLTPPDSPPPPIGDLEWVNQATTTTSLGTTRMWRIEGIVPYTPALIAMNPAHILYYSRTVLATPPEPPEGLNEASFTAAANWFHAQGFGLCPEYDPAAESLEEFEQRICRAAGCGMTRSLIDGQWYIDIANGEYELDDLPILDDDDILDFEEQPTLPDSAVNSVSVKYFDTVRKEAVVTRPVQSLALIAEFGTNHLTIEYPEIPTHELALRVAQRELTARESTVRAFQLKTTRKPYAWRPSTYFRLQSYKRRIADMVCIFGVKNSGTLRSGAMSIAVTQDVYSLPQSVYVGVETGVDTRPSQDPQPIVHRRAIEAPYIELASALAKADLDVLDAEAGFLLTVAADPAVSRDYTLMVSASGDYQETGTGTWCPSCVNSEEVDEVTEMIAFSSATRLHEVNIGDVVLWDDEICRVDGVDVEDSTITLGRGCADTVARKHDAGGRMWFYGNDAGFDPTEYTDGQAIEVKLLTNTGNAQLALDAITALAVTFNQRQARPYPPGLLKIDGADYPAAVEGEFEVSWAHRNRVVQADQLVDASMASVTLAPNTRYGLRFRRVDTNAVLVVRTDIGPGAATVTLNHTGDVKLELWSIDDVGDSWQTHEHVFAYTPPAGSPTNTITAGTWTPVETVIDGGEVSP